VRGWKEAELRQLIELNEGDTMWFRMRRKADEYVTKVLLRACLRASFAPPPSQMHGGLSPLSLSHGYALRQECTRYAWSQRPRPCAAA